MDSKFADILLEFIRL